MGIINKVLEIDDKKIEYKISNHNSMVSIEVEVDEVLDMKIELHKVTKSYLGVLETVVKQFIQQDLFQLSLKEIFSFFKATVVDVSFFLRSQYILSFAAECDKDTYFAKYHGIFVTLFYGDLLGTLTYNDIKDYNPKQPFLGKEPYIFLEHGYQIQDRLTSDTTVVSIADFGSKRDYRICGDVASLLNDNVNIYLNPEGDFAVIYGDNVVNKLSSLNYLNQVRYFSTGRLFVFNEDDLVQLAKCIIACNSPAIVIKDIINYKAVI